MAFRTLIYLCEASGRCFLTPVRRNPRNLEIFIPLKHTRGFKRIRDVAEQSESQIALHQTDPKFRSLWKPFVFTILFGSAVHVGAVVWEYERLRHRGYTVLSPYEQWRMGFHLQREGWRGELQQWWKGLSDGQKVFAPICFLNAVVFLAWKMPRYQTTMIRYFCSNPASSAICWPMILSTFSHNSLLHIVVNMHVLHSFSTAAVDSIGKEQFMALYLTGGVLSSFVSLFYRTLFSRPGLSLGASGAIMGVIGFVCMLYPDTQLNLAFFPMFTFSASNAIKALLVVDTTGCLMGWRFLDHAAHLGGAFWGIFWQGWGNSRIWQKLEPVRMLWHSIREPPRS